MAQKYYNSADAAKILGVSPAEINQMVLRRELYGYKDGADWKFKPEDIERVAAERGGGHDDSGDNVLASEIELGQSDPGMSGTVIGADKSRSTAESDIRLAESDVKLAKGGGSDLNIQGSDIDLAGPKQAAGAKRGDVGSKVSQFEDLDMTLDHDLTLEDSNVAVSPAKPGKPAAAATADSALDISGKKLEDDDLVLGGSGTGSDISIGGDSGISLVDPSDSGLSLEAPLNLGSGEESLELGEDDLLGMASGVGGSGLKGEDDFQLTPMDDLSDGEDSESGSQVIALDTEGEGDEAATMVASSGTPVAAMLDEDLGEAGLAAMPLGAATDLGLASPEDALAMGGFGASAAALPEAPYSIWNIVSLVFVSMLLILVGMMMYELLRNMWGFEKPIKTAEFDTWLMDMILHWFEK